MLIAAGLLLTLGALAWSAQGLLLYPAPVATPPTAADVAPAQLVALPPSYALYLPAPGAAADRPAPLMIFAHGNAEAAVQWLPEVEALHEAGLSLLLLEYPGYAGAEGRPDRRSLRAVALAAHDWARAQPAVDPERIVAYGRSLGGGVVAELAAARPLAALGLESSFASLPRLVSELGWPSWLLRDRFVPEQALADFAAPVLLVHGWRDEVIGIGHAHSLRAALPQAQLLELDCGHNDCPRPWPAWLALLAEAGVLPLAPPVAESAQGNAWR